MNKIKISAPATIANLVCGFDVLGLALNEPRISWNWHSVMNRVCESRHTDGYALPVAPEKNVAGAALLALMEELTEPLALNSSSPNASNPVVDWVPVQPVLQVR